MSRAAAPRPLVEEAGLSSPEEDGLEGLAGANDLGRVARGQQLVQRAVLEVAGQQAREPLGRQVDLLEQVGLAAGQAQPFEIQGRRAGLQLEGRGDGHRRRLGPGGDQARLGIQAALAASRR